MWQMQLDEGEWTSCGKQVKNQVTISSSPYRQSRDRHYRITMRTAWHCLLPFGRSRCTFLTCQSRQV